MSAQQQPSATNPPSDAGVHDPKGDMLMQYLTQDDWQSALQRIQRDRRPLSPDLAERRKAGQRYDHVLTCLLRVELDGHSEIHLVRTRDVSRGGLSVLHGGVIPPEADCLVAVEISEGEGKLMRAHVVRCREVEVEHASQKAYEIGLQFEGELDVETFLDTDNAEA